MVSVLYSNQHRTQNELLVDLIALIIYIRGYCMVAQRRGLYFPVVKTIFYDWVQQVSKILFLTGENKIHIFKPTVHCVRFLDNLNE